MCASAALPATDRGDGVGLADVFQEVAYEIGMLDLLWRCTRIDGSVQWSRIHHLLSSAPPSSECASSGTCADDARMNARNYRNPYAPAHSLATHLHHRAVASALRSATL